MRFSRSDLWSKGVLVVLLVVGAVIYDQQPVTVSMDRMNEGLAMLIVVLGSFMENVRRNPIYGLRLPWTLANDEVWLRSNRVGGRLMVLAGVILFTVTLLGVGGTAPLLVLLGIAVGIGTMYSYLVHREVMRRDPMLRDPGGHEK